MASYDVSYDYEDFGMTALELETKYNGNGTGHPEYHFGLWHAKPGPQTEEPPHENYWEWVANMIMKDCDGMPSNDEQGGPIPTPEPEIVPIADMDLFAGLLVEWHRRKMAMLRHMMRIPPGTEFTVGMDGKETTLILDGDILKAFCAGLITAINEMGELPFTAIPKEDEAPVPEQSGTPDVSA